MTIYNSEWAMPNHNTYDIKPIAAGIKATQQDTQSSFYTKFKNLIPPLVKEGGLVLSFGWNSSCMGKKFGEYEEILLVGHGGAHNDTICVAQRKFYEQ